MKRLFFDIETSPNIGLFWQPGHKVSIGYESIIKERAIICAAWKWEGEEAVHSITWNKKQDDKRVVQKLAELLTEADEVVSHNGDRFDIPWVRGRCLKFGIGLPPRLVSMDTCAIARSKLKLNSNRLDYIAQYLGLDGKLPTGYGLWKTVLLDNDRVALRKMEVYCQQDVRVLEQVWGRMKSLVAPKTRFHDGARVCPECGSHKMSVSKRRTTAAGHKTVQLVCGDCGKYVTMPARKFDLVR